MKKFPLLMILLPAALFAQMSEEKIQAAMEKPFNPFSIILPKKEVLARIGAPRVMDMGASSYANGFLYRALRLYNAVIELYPGDTEALTWAHYEIAFIYYNLLRKNKALEHLDLIMALPAPDPIALKLAETLAARLRNPKDYRVYLKQEDVLFDQEKKQRRLDMKQIAQEEAAIRKTQLAQEKENKRILKLEREEAKRQKKAGAENPAKL